MKLLAAHFRSGLCFEFEFEGPRLAARQRRDGPADLVFGPAFFDLQCNGYSGIDFAHPDTTVPQIAGAVRAMWKRGCGAVLPTLITACPERLERHFERLTEALETDAAVRAGVPGFHLEGPFISPLDGARGAHPLEHVREPDPALWRRWQKAARGRIRLVTLAPEVRGALPFIRQLRSEGVAVALGHTLAGRAQIAAAADAGATLSTHLGNGCPQVMARHLNPIFAQLGEDRLQASVIADGVHLPAEVLRSFWRVKGPKRTILVSDAMAAADAPPGRYSLGDLWTEVSGDGVVRLPGTQHLAGSSLTMEAAVSNFCAMTGAPLFEAWEAAALQPWRIFGARLPAAASRGMAIFGRQKNGGLQTVAVIRGDSLLFAA